MPLIEEVKRNKNGKVIKPKASNKTTTKSTFDDREQTPQEGGGGLFSNLAKNAGSQHGDLLGNSLPPSIIQNLLKPPPRATKGG